MWIIGKNMESVLILYSLSTEFPRLILYSWISQGELRTLESLVFALTKWTLGKTRHNKHQVFRYGPSTQEEFFNSSYDYLKCKYTSVGVITEILIFSQQLFTRQYLANIYRACQSLCGACLILRCHMESWVKEKKKKISSLDFLPPKGLACSKNPGRKGPKELSGRAQRQEWTRVL